MAIPKSAMDAADIICTQFGISLFDDSDKVALIIAEPINKAIKRLELTLDIWTDAERFGQIPNMKKEIAELKFTLSELKGDDNG